MRKSKGDQLLLTLGFLVIIFGVGVTQAGIELIRGERPLVFDLVTHAPTEAHLRTFENDLEEGSWFAQQLRPTMQYLQFLALGDAGEYALMGREEWFFYQPGVEYLVEPCHNLDEVASVIASFRDQLAQRGIQLLVMPMPGKASVYPDKLTARAAGLAPTPPSHTETLLAKLENAGVATVDLFEAYRRKRAEAAPPPRTRGDAPLYLERDTHWTPEGVRFAAETVARTLLDRGWVEKGTVPYGLEPATIQRRGDVLRMMQTPRVEAHFAPQEVTCARVVRADTGEAYQDDPESTVLVLGDSFMRIYERDEPGAAGFIAHLAHELGFPVASIVNDGGASTLVRQELSRRPTLLANKKVVIWEFVERDIRFGTEGWQEIPLPKHI